jgi:hypothetical protein
MSYTYEELIVCHDKCKYGKEKTKVSIVVVWKSTQRLMYSYYCVRGKECVTFVHWF